MIRYIALTAMGLLIAVLTLLVLTLPTPLTNAADSDSMAAAETAETTETSGSTANTTLLRNVRVFTENGLGAPVSILMVDGLIETIGDVEESSADTVIEGNGLTALPGLIDSHTHSYGTSLNDALRFGVSTQLDMFTDIGMVPTQSLRSARENLLATDQADLFTAGTLATAPGGHGTQYGVDVETITAPEQAAAWVEARKAEGSDYIKMVYMPEARNLPSLDRDTAKALIDAAHAQQMLALAHIWGHDSAQELIEDGIDGLVHIFGDQPVTDELLVLARERGVFIIPTLAVIGSLTTEESLQGVFGASAQEAFLSPMQQQTLAGRFGRNYSDTRLLTAQGNVERFHRAGVPILAGSDAPNPGTAMGVSLHHEMQLLVRSGLSETEALLAASSWPAEQFGLQGRGSLREGHRADLFLVDGDPTQDIFATLNIARIFKNGHPVERALNRETGEPMNVETLGDFEAGMTAPEGFSWDATDDRMAGGQSLGTMNRVAGGAGGSEHALRIDAAIKAGFPYPWAGAGLMSASIATGLGSDISGFETVRFDVKGTPGSYRLMAFNAGMMGIPPTQNFTVSPDWETITLSLEGFEGALLNNFAGFGFVAGPVTGESTIYLDNVRLVE